MNSEVTKNEQGERKKMGREERDLLESVFEQSLEFGKDLFDPNVLNRLKKDWDNKTMDYSRMNYFEVFSAFNCDVKNSVSHWRMAKIADGMIIASEQLKILKQDIGPSFLAKVIYPMLKEGRGEEKMWKIQLINPKDKSEPPKPVDAPPASLADFAHLVDMMKFNRELGVNKMNLNQLVFDYFMGNKLGVVIDEGQKKIEVDFRDNKLNPYDDMSDIDIDSYMARVLDTNTQNSLQLNDSFRYTSDGHREMAGHALQMQYGSYFGETAFMPLSGLMANKITMGDLLKQEKNGMMGQPQEIAECEEDQTGAFIRFNLVDLQQRQRGGDIKNTQKTQRMSKAMVGLTLLENAKSQIKTVLDPDTKKDKYLIHIGGKNLDGKIIKGMQLRYKESSLAVRGRELNEKEAADIVLTDVLIPCVANNPNDWLTAVVKTYGVGGKKGSQTLLNDRDAFQDFEIVLWGRDMTKPPDYPIVKLPPFKGFNSLWKYMCQRIDAGHVDQPGIENYVSKVSEAIKSFEDIGENDYYKEKIDASEGANLYKVLESILGKSSQKHIAEYIKNGPSTLFQRWPDGTGKKTIDMPGARMDFDGMLLCLLEEKILKEPQDPNVVDAMETFYDMEEEFEKQVGGDNKFFVRGFMATIQSLGDKDRKKIKPTNK